MQSPARPASVCPAQASGTWSTTTASETSTSPRVRDCTKRSGSVTENPIAKTIHGESSATRRPSSSPTSAENPAPRMPPTSDVPASAKTPAAPPAVTSASQDDDTTWRATPDGSRPIRASGTDVTRPSEDEVTATSADAARYAYPKLVTEPTPSRAANGRQTR